MSKQKYPKSVNNLQCISKCYAKNTPVVHPITLENVTNINDPFCSIIPVRMDDGTYDIIDKCTLDEMSDNESEQTIDESQNLDILYPIINFDGGYFLKKYYKINDISDFYFWLKNNKNVTVFTKLRIIDCFIMEFGKTVTVIEDIFSDTIIDIIKKFWIKRMYNKLCKFIDKNGNIIDPAKNKLKKSDDVANRTKNIVTKFVTPQNILEISNNFFTDIQKKDTIIGIDDFYSFVVDALEGKMKKMFE